MKCHGVGAVVLKVNPISVVKFGKNIGTYDIEWAAGWAPNYTRILDSFIFLTQLKWYKYLTLSTPENNIVRNFISLTILLIWESLLSDCSQVLKLFFTLKIHELRYSIIDFTLYTYASTELQWWVTLFSALAGGAVT